ncbi:MAG: S9 family peptidase [Bacteroidales bacterium]|nr:S9 family peptidase [Bacteroidales bacterium]
MKKIAFLGIIVLLTTHINAQDEKIVPSFEQVLSLKSAGAPVISPDGNHILFTVTQTDWENNRYDSEIWISRDRQEPFQLTNNPEGNSDNPQWSPDGKWISFTSSRGDKNQIYVIYSEGGEAFPVTGEKNGVGAFKWSPDGTRIAFTVQEDSEKADKKREDRYGSFAVEDEEYKLTRLMVIDFNPDYLEFFPLPCYEEDSLKKEQLCKKGPEPEKLIDSVDFTITSYDWSPDGKMIAFNHQPDPLINSFIKSDISILYTDTKKIVTLVANTSADGFYDWSPDSKSILYTSHVDNTSSNFYTNSRYFRIDIDGKNNKELGKDFDENLSGLKWTRKGIYATAYQKTLRSLLLMNPDNGKIIKVLESPDRINGFSISRDGKKMAFSGAEDESLSEVYINNLDNNEPLRLTSFTDQIKNWKHSIPEVISWKSKDGNIIEGILHKPMDYDPDKKYPLLVNIHGGPTGISLPEPVPSYVYPVLQWLDKGALVLMPNYRGSAGYGEEFRKLNVENLGVGDAWDVMSGIEYLAGEGIIDTSRMGAMGWSQGGYISAFLTTNTDAFKAISVGAGISNWMTYYVNTDIHPFTRQYLKATPWENEEIYRKTSPMTNIKNASTPTLIQHGEFDRRVPIPNAYELFQGLQDVGVDTKLIVYMGFGHGITKPKERLAAMWHNWQWFGKYLWGEEIDLPAMSDER